MTGGAILTRTTMPSRRRRVEGADMAPTTTDIRRVLIPTTWALLLHLPSPSNNPRQGRGHRSLVATAGRER